MRGNPGEGDPVVVEVRSLGRSGDQDCQRVMDQRPGPDLLVDQLGQRGLILTADAYVSLRVPAPVRVARQARRGQLPVHLIDQAVQAGIEAGG